ALPKDYIQWMHETDLKGIANIGMRLSGKYIGDTEIKPDLSLKMDIRDGYIAHNSAPEPLKNLHFDFETTIPGLNPDSLSVNIDSISFTIEKGYFGGMLHIKGIENPHIDTRIHSAIDLAKLQRATGLEGFEMSGNYSLHLLAKGDFIQKQNPKSSVPDTIVTSIPSFDLKSSITNGLFKNASTQQPVNNISFDVKANCPNHDYMNTNISVKNLNATYLSNYIKGYLDYYGGRQMKVDAKMKALLKLSSLEKIYPVDSLNMEGDLRFDVAAKGKMDIDKKIFPATNAIINLKNGLVQTKYYPLPFEKINIDALVKTSDGSLKNTSLFIKPLSFYFEEQPFELKASLKNFDNLQYDISAKGAADLGHLSKVFAMEDLDYTGYIKANVA
ncbi:MAG: hypothetical protein ACK5XN_20825, partial [Bacteroidota bacterium]